MNQDRSRGLQSLVRPDRAEAVLWTRLREDNEVGAREPLFNRYAGLARSIAARARPHGCDRSAARDAEQWAYEGLLQAIDAYDPARGVPFEAYAKHRITGSVRDGFATSTEMAAQYSSRRRLESERLRSLRVSESGAESTSMEALAELAVGLALGMMIEGTAVMAREDDADPRQNAYDSLEWRQIQARLSRELERLPDSEAVVIKQHYEHGLAFARIAEMIGLSRGRVSQLHRSALTRLRKRLGKGFA